MRCDPVQNESLRNIAIIAHVDHGKTTLVDEMLKQGGAFRENQEVKDRVMDSGDLERERGITILAKNTAIQYGDVKINIVDTPGHADFGGEVERILKMVNGVILLVDAAEGPMPQTRFVLSRALDLGHRVIVVINKIDRPDQRIHEVMDEVLELLLDLDATDEQLDSPMLFCSARQGICSRDPDVLGTDLKPLFETILSYIPAPEADTEKPFQMLVSSIDYNEFVGRIAIGRIEQGTIKQNQEITVCNYHDPDQSRKAKAVSLYQFEGLARMPVSEASAGNIIAMSGIGDITIGDTICAAGLSEPLPFVKISAPTMEMTFSVNDSPFAGREGKYVTSRNLRDRLMRETLKDVSGGVRRMYFATAVKPTVVPYWRYVFAGFQRSLMTPNSAFQFRFMYARYVPSVSAAAATRSRILFLVFRAKRYSRLCSQRHTTSIIVINEVTISPVISNL